MMKSPANRNFLTGPTSRVVKGVPLKVPPLPTPLIVPEFVPTMIAAANAGPALAKAMPETAPSSAVRHALRMLIGGAMHNLPSKRESGQSRQITCQIINLANSEG